MSILKKLIGFLERISRNKLAKSKMFRGNLKKLNPDLQQSLLELIILLFSLAQNHLQLTASSVLKRTPTPILIRVDTILGSDKNKSLLHSLEFNLTYIYSQLK